MKQVAFEIKNDLKTNFPDMEFDIKYVLEEYKETYCRLTGKKHTRIDNEHILINLIGGSIDLMKKVIKFTDKYRKGYYDRESKEYVIVEKQTHIKNKVKYVSVFITEKLCNKC